MPLDARNVKAATAGGTKASGLMKPKTAALKAPKRVAENIRDAQKVFAA